MTITRYHVQGLAIGLILSGAHSSAAPAPGSRNAAQSSNPLSPGSLEEEPNNESFKENEDWWKDPFAMFDDDDDEEEENEASDKDRASGAGAASTIEAEDDDEEEEILVMEEVAKPAFVPAPVVKQKRVVKPKEPKPVKPVKVPAAKAVVHPLVEAQVAASTPVDTSISGLHVAPVLPAVRKLGSLLGSLPLVQVLASFAFVKILQPMVDSRTGPNNNNKESSNRDNTFENDLEDEDDPVDDRSGAYNNNAPVPHKKVKRGGANPGGTGWLSKIFGESNPVERLPPARELMDQVEYLQGEVDTLRNEKESVEREYEKASWQLQETQNEHANLQSTTNYLKVQLRDNQEVMDRAVRAERRKAKEELTKMKEAMLQVLQRERQELRAKMVRQTKEVQAKMRQAEESGSIAAT
eukprot:CAMPEP_0119011120 /NCGR_PEP_ID=MMETSP1176-20130426/5467_1 /TAXON_ID=265551 /ORGANISM="Synedropsis recta cf, Strain CCMP1620" /LENGTH=409 /DNA_ID=CAMNT_0006963895 /DNA_START=30 /DNA_END=1259 /DNA_ORIENTATION=-